MDPKNCQLGSKFGSPRKLFHGEKKMPLSIQINTKKVLLSHGDALCIDDVDYINFRNQVRDKGRTKSYR